MAKVLASELDSDYFKINEGLGDDIEVSFILTFTPITLANLEVYINGVLRKIVTDYSLSVKTVTFTFVPRKGQEITFKYLKKEA